MGDNINPSSTAGLNPGGSETFIKITRITMVVTAIFVFLVIAFVLFLYLHSQYSLSAWATYRRRRWGSSNGRSPFAFISGDVLPSLGLDPAVLLSLPVTIYLASEFKQGIECSICLSELSDGEKARVLPGCGHGFHLECIDMWFQSHSTCPVCRCLVRGEDSNHLPEAQTPEETMPEILIPDQSSEMLQSSPPPSPLSSNRFEAAEMNAPVEGSGSPAESKVESLRRILSGGKSAGCRRPGVDDIEQGVMGFGEGSSVYHKDQ